MFTTYPDSYESLYSELIYSYVKTSSSEDFMVLVLNYTTDELLAVKKFYSSTSADINIAPLVRRHAYPDIVVTPTGFVDESNSSSIAVLLMDDSGAMASCRYFTLSRSCEDEVGLLTTLETTNRTMILGERDFVLMRVDPSVAVSVSLYYYIDGYEEPVEIASYQAESQPSGFVTFAIVAEYSYGYAVDRVEFIATQGDNTIAELEYIIIDPPTDPVRVAWVSTRGSIEHYTFPYVVERSRSKGLQQSLTLRSALENYSMRLALAEILESPKVWVESSAGVYLEASVESEQMEMLATTQIGSVDLKISYYDE